MLAVPVRRYKKIKSVKTNEKAKAPSKKGIKLIYWNIPSKS
jgi:hypothetical protein